MKLIDVKYRVEKENIIATETYEEGRIVEIRIDKGIVNYIKNGNEKKNE